MALEGGNLQQAATARVQTAKTALPDMAICQALVLLHNSLSQAFLSGQQSLMPLDQAQLLHQSSLLTHASSNALTQDTTQVQSYVAGCVWSRRGP